MSIRWDKFIWVYGLYPKGNRNRLARQNKWTARVDVYDTNMCQWKRVAEGLAHRFIRWRDIPMTPPKTRKSHLHDFGEGSSKAAAIGVWIAVALMAFLAWLTK